jgi:hypothetical protein
MPADGRNRRGKRNAERQQHGQKTLHSCEPARNVSPFSISRRPWLLLPSVGGSRLCGERRPLLPNGRAEAKLEELDECTRVGNAALRPGEGASRC